MARFKTEKQTYKLKDAVDTAFSEFECLRDELEEWQGNLEGNNMEHLPKYDEVTEACDILQNNRDAPEQPDTLGDSEVTVMRMLPYGRKPEPRWMRMANAVNLLRAVIDDCESVLEEQECSPTPDQEVDEDLRTYKEELETICDEIECVEFPRMFG